MLSDPYPPGGAGSGRSCPRYPASFVVNARESVGPLTVGG